MIDVANVMGWRVEHRRPSPPLPVRNRVMGKVREAMRPEFLNRIDEIVLFQKLDQPQLEQIVRLMLGASAARRSAREVAFEVTAEILARV
ncbi:hypothetical protein [Agromyces humatus]|uniref:Uncharacterized protein n=1 Tax=Agromyces humatus TaxID=279573 RepID=A0ABN2KB09_9MICO|nr:hypothetical protein [Agromyces humatus]